MYYTKFILKKFLIFVLFSQIISAISISRRNINPQVKTSKKGFFGSLATLEGFESEDVLEMFRNAGAVENPEKIGDCGGECRTPIAFWMLQPLLPCASIIKGNCPIGLVCCERINDGDESSVGNRTAHIKLRTSLSEPTDEFFIPEEDIEFIRNLAQVDK